MSIPLITAITAGAAVLIESLHYRACKKKDEKLSAAAVFTDALKNLVIIFLGALVAMWVTNYSTDRNNVSQLLKTIDALEGAPSSSLYYLSIGAAQDKHAGDESHSKLFMLASSSAAFDSGSLFGHFLLSETAFPYIDPGLVLYINERMENRKNISDRLQGLFASLEDTPEDGELKEKILSTIVEFAKNDVNLLDSLEMQRMLLEHIDYEDEVLHLPPGAESRWQSFCRDMGISADE